MKMKTVLRISCGGNKSLSFLTIVLAISLALTLQAGAQSGLAKISVDNLTNSDSVHKTEVEPDIFAGQYDCEHIPCGAAAGVDWLG